ncbi:MAG: 4Fe-4S binding protein [Candidatus Omnitrophota bacterium]
MLRPFRRVFQLLFFIAFLVLILLTEGRYDALIDKFVIRYPVSVILKIDPLIMFSAGLATWQLPPAFISSVVLLTFTLFFGRFFCGWACPLGSLIDFAERRLFRKGMIRKKPLAVGYRRIKYLILLFILITAVFGVQTAGYFDPLAIITRFFITAILPAFLAIVNLILGIFNSVLNFTFKGKILLAQTIFLRDAYNSFIFNFENSLFSLEMTSYSTSAIILGFTVFIFGLSIFGHRFWCKNICPLGALLGICSEFSPLRRKIREDCDECAICLTHCHAQVKNFNAVKDSYQAKECIRCFECVNICRKKKMFFGLSMPPGILRRSNFLPSRRQFLLTAAGSGLFVGYMRSVKWIPNSKFLIRPPGADREERFINKCIRCGQCMKVCPTKVIQPSFLESGLVGFWTPRLNYQVGYCDDVCTRCGQVCPTGAIKDLTKEQRRLSKIGTAFFDKDHCLPWYKNENCIKCEEHCPVADKAISYTEVEVITEEKETKIVKRPYVNEEACIGCGICEYKCPVTGGPGIVVTNYKEKR